MHCLSCRFNIAKATIIMMEPRSSLERQLINMGSNMPRSIDNGPFIIMLYCL